MTAPTAAGPKKHVAIPIGTVVVIGNLEGVIDSDPIPVKEARKKGLTNTSRTSGFVYKVRAKRWIASDVKSKTRFYEKSVVHRHTSNIKIKR